MHAYFSGEAVFSKMIGDVLSTKNPYNKNNLGRVNDIFFKTIMYSVTIYTYFWKFKLKEIIKGQTMVTIYKFILNLDILWKRQEILKTLFHW